MITVRKLTSFGIELYECLNFFKAENIPKFYHYFPQNDEREEIIVTELLGRNLETLLQKYKRFSIVTSMKIGLQVVR